MSETTMAPMIQEREQQLEALREQHAATVTAIETAERELTPAERALEEARQMYNHAAAEVARALVAMGPGDPSATWTERSGRQQAASEDALRAARAAFEQAEAELAPRLVSFNSLNGRRGDLQMRRRFLEAQIEQTEAQVTRAAAKPDDLLAGIRARLGLGPSTPAA